MLKVFGEVSFSTIYSFAGPMNNSSHTKLMQKFLMLSEPFYQQVGNGLT